jgi:hypothetical protein
VLLAAIAGAGWLLNRIARRHDRPTAR